MGKALTLTKLTQPVVKITKDTIRFVSKNSNLILTIVSVTGVLTTVVVAVQGTIKAVKLCEEKQVKGTKEVIKTVWKCYIPTVGLVILTTTAILCNGKINAKRLAVLTSAYSGSIETIKKIEEKMSEQIGPKKTQKAIDEAEADLAQANAPKDKNEIIITGKGNQLFWLKSTNQWFYSDHNGLELAQLKIQHDIEKYQGKMFEDYYPVSCALKILDLPETEMGNYMAWPLDLFNESHPFEFIISSEWVDLPWGREIVGIVRFSDWPENF